MPALPPAAGKELGGGPGPVVDIEKFFILRVVMLILILVSSQTRQRLLIESETVLHRNLIVVCVPGVGLEGNQG